MAQDFIDEVPASEFGEAVEFAAADAQLATTGLAAVANKDSIFSTTWPLFVAVGLLMMGVGLSGTLLGVRAGLEDFGVLLSGLIMASYYVGFFFGSTATERFVAGVGHIRVFAALASAASTAVLVHSVVVEPFTWMAMRFISGACAAGLYIVIESWLNDAASPINRGRMLATYMVVSMGGIAAGQYLLNVADVAGFTLFILASILVSMSLVPVALSAAATPPFTVPTPISLKELVSVVPSGVISSFWVGAAHGTMIGIGAVYGTAIGASATWVAAFVTMPILGSLLSQHVVGKLSDRLPRRGLMLAIAALAYGMSVGLVFVPEGSTATLIVMFVLGAATFPLYSLVIAYSNDWVRADQIVGTSAALVRTNGAGAIVGPLLATALMTFFGSRWFFATLALAHAMIVLYLLYRIYVADPLPIERQRRFVVFPARAGVMAATLIPRRRHLRGNRYRKGGGAEVGSDDFSRPPPGHEANGTTHLR